VNPIYDNDQSAPSSKTGIKWFQVHVLECEKAILYILDLGMFVLNGRIYMAFSYVWSLLGFVLPVITLIYCNVHLVRALRESCRMRRLYVVNARVATSCGSRVTPTLVAVVCMYLVLITPSELLQFYYYTVRRESVEIFNTAIVATNVLQTTNFALNFVLYSVVNVHFRETWTKLVYCAVCRRWRGRSAGRRGREGSFEVRQPPDQQNASSRRHPVDGSSRSVSNHVRLHRQQPMTVRRSVTTANLTSTPVDYGQHRDRH